MLLIRAHSTCTNLEIPRNEMIVSEYTCSQSLLLVQLCWAGGQEHVGHFHLDQHDSTAEYFQKSGRCHFLLKAMHNTITLFWRPWKLSTYLVVPLLHHHEVSSEKRHNINW